MKANESHFAFIDLLLLARHSRIGCRSPSDEVAGGAARLQAAALLATSLLRQPLSFAK
jgi:hypothetical protein